MNETEIKAQAAEFRERLGGTIFAFPIQPDKPFSKYAIVVYAGGIYHVYPEAQNITLAAGGVLTALELMTAEGHAISYENDVRMISHDAQMNAPDVTMRRLRKDQEKVTKNIAEYEKDFRPNGDGYDITARGLIKLSRLMVQQDKNPKAVQFMNEYYKLLEARKYGKTAAAIKQEVRRMDKHDFLEWADKTYDRYVRNGSEIFDIMNRLRTNV